MPYIGRTYLPFLVSRDSDRGREIVERNYVGHKPTVDEVDVSIESGAFQFMLMEGEHEQDLTLEEQEESTRNLLDTSPAANPFEFQDSRGYLAVGDLSFNKEPRMEGLPGEISFSFLDDKEYRPSYDCSVTSPPTDFNFDYPGLLAVPSGIESPEVRSVHGGSKPDDFYLYHNGGMVYPWVEEGNGTAYNAGRSLKLEADSGTSHVWKTSQKVDLNEVRSIQFDFNILNVNGGELFIEFPEQGRSFRYNKVGGYDEKINATFFEETEVVLRAEGDISVRFWEIEVGSVPNVNSHYIGYYNPTGGHTNLYRVQDGHRLLYENPHGGFAEPEKHSYAKVFNGNGQQVFEEGEMVTDGRVETGVVSIDLETQRISWFDLYANHWEWDGDPDSAEYKEIAEITVDFFDRYDRWFIREIGPERVVITPTTTDDFKLIARRGMPYFEFAMDTSSFGFDLSVAEDNADITWFNNAHREGPDIAAFQLMRGGNYVDAFVSRNYKAGGWDLSYSNDTATWTGIPSYRSESRMKFGIVGRDIDNEDPAERFIRSCLVDTEIEQTLIDRNYL